jgi:hypothetical protein
MSPSTRSPRADGRRPHAARLLPPALAVLLLFAAPLSASVQAPPLPPAVTSVAPSLELRGGGELTIFGLSIYDGFY